MSKSRYVIEPLAGKGVVIRLHGSIDLYSSPDLRLALGSELNDGNELILMDMSGVEFIDSSAIATLAEGLSWSRRKRRRFVIAGMSGILLDIFSIAKLDAVFEIVDDAEPFLASLET